LRTSHPKGTLVGPLHETCMQRPAAVHRFLPGRQHTNSASTDHRESTALSAQPQKGWQKRLCVWWCRLEGAKLFVSKFRLQKIALGAVCACIHPDYITSPPTKAMHKRPVRSACSAPYRGNARTSFPELRQPLNLVAASKVTLLHVRKTCDLRNPPGLSSP
jgi:hypothetical protein